MTAATLTLTDFLLARIAEDEATANRAIGASNAQWERDGAAVVFGCEWVIADASLPTADHIARHDPARALAECEAKRRIVEFHKSWPVLVETQPDFDFGVRGGTVEATTLRMTKQIAWLTEQEYRTKFGTEPPTAPVLLALAAIYADHPDYRDEWRVSPRNDE